MMIIKLNTTSQSFSAANNCTRMTKHQAKIFNSENLFENSKIMSEANSLTLSSNRIRLCNRFLISFILICGHTKIDKSVKVKLVVNFVHLHN